MDEPIEDEYFNWLYAKVAYRRINTPSTRFESLLYFLHRTEFMWIISGDQNRAEEGQELRRQFLFEVHGESDTSWMELECSVLEMLIAFCRRAQFHTEIPAEEWFWVCMNNLGLGDISDAAYSDPNRSSIIGQVIEEFLDRQYAPDGRGGLFPLRNPPEDQRLVEIWYQFCAYLVDQDIV